MAAKTDSRPRLVRVAAVLSAFVLGSAPAVSQHDPAANARLLLSQGRVLDALEVARTEVAKAQAIVPTTANAR